MARHVSAFVSGSAAFGVALGLVVVWAASGPFFGYSEAWQLVINTGTTIVTFLMVFLIQRTQQKDSVAMHLKLNELIAALRGASNRLLTAEELSEDELEVLRRHYREILLRAQQEPDPGSCHSIDEHQTPMEAIQHAADSARRRNQ
ncbi:MAG: low affinity iron permease family protein [Candidatus Binatia bacterium]